MPQKPRDSEHETTEELKLYLNSTVDILKTFTLPLGFFGSWVPTQAGVSL